MSIIKAIFQGFYKPYSEQQLVKRNFEFKKCFWKKLLGASIWVENNSLKSGGCLQTLLWWHIIIRNDFEKSKKIFFFENFQAVFGMVLSYFPWGWATPKTFFSKFSRKIIFSQKAWVKSCVWSCSSSSEAYRLTWRPNIDISVL